VTLLNVIRFDRLPNLRNFLDLVALVEIKKLDHEVHDGFGLDAISTILIEGTFL